MSRPTFPPLDPADPRLEALAARVRHEFAMLAYPEQDWVRPVAHPSGRHVFDVAIVGGGQSGLATAAGLRRDRVTNVVVLDAVPAGFEGPWETYARMDTLRTPKYQVGIEHGLPSLAFRSWYEIQFGAASWEALDRVPRTYWMAYLRWYRRTLGIPVRNDCAVVDIASAGNLLELHLEKPAGGKVILARRVVLATGYDGAGSWVVPDFITAALPPDRYTHSNMAIDAERLRGRRIGVLGHGASSFDSAVFALDNGAVSVDHCFRRAELPVVNPHRWIEYVGLLKHYPEFDDAIRWRIMLHFRRVDQPPTQNGVNAATSFANYRLHPGCAWDRVSLAGDAVEVATPRGRFAFDYLICATGSAPDIASRPELKSFAPKIALWRDIYRPEPSEENAVLGAYPYLGPYYELTEKTPGDAPYLRHIHAYNFASAVSCGPHSTSISGHKHAVPRLIRGITRSLFLEQQDTFLDGLYAYDEPEIRRPPLAAE
jgi:cation diffusion facilitator CzcD-associated flavoprotein CzcO